MRNVRAIAGGVIVCGYLFASGVFVGGAAAQVATAEPVGQPMQLLQLLKFGRTEAKPRAKLAARSVARSSARSKTHMAQTRMTQTRMAHLALRRKTRPHIMVAEQKPQPQQLLAQSQPAPRVAEASAADNTAPAAPTAMTVDATTLAPAPPIVAPVAAVVPSELVVDGQTIQVASADEANEIDLAANDASVAASDASLVATSAPDAATAEMTAAPAANSDSAGAAVAQTQRAEIGSTSWLLQVMAALGGAVAAGSVAWFLIGSAPQRMYG
jgi:hypothetical protein